MLLLDNKKQIQIDHLNIIFVCVHLNWPAQVHLIHHGICKFLDREIKGARENEREK